MEDGMIVPYGKQIAPPLPVQSSLLYNEYIVYNTAQIRMRSGPARAVQPRGRQQ
jgi:hypothetical protein